MLPGRLLHRVADLLVDEFTVSRVVEPLLADFQREWQSSTGGSHIAAIGFRGYGAFWRTLVRLVTAAFLREASTPPASDISLRAVRAFLAAIGAAVVAQILVLTYSSWPIAPNRTAIGLTAISGVLLGIGPAMLPALLRTWGENKPPRAADTVKIALIGLMLIVALVGWIVPVASRSIGLRLANAARPASCEEPCWHPEQSVLVSPNNQTWSELWRASDNRSVWGSRYRAESLHRAAIVALAASLMLLGWVVGRFDLRGPRHQSAARAALWWLLLWSINRNASVGAATAAGLALAGLVCAATSQRVSLEP